MAASPSTKENRGQVMRILITNDDGIAAPGLAVLEDIAQSLTPPSNIWTVAPAFEQSGVGHCISYTKPMMIQPRGPRRVACDGYPADCVLAGVHEVMEDRPDLVLSGINRGNNSAENALYSGTLGAAMEGALQGIPSIALSQYFGPQNAKLDDPFEAARAHSAEVIRNIQNAMPASQDGYQLFFNVNIPPVPASDVKGVRICPQGLRPGKRFRTEPLQSPSGRSFLWIRGGDQHVQTAAGTDASMNLGGYISVTPMRADLTAHDLLDTFGSLNT